MVLVDSNIIIYSYSLHTNLRNLLIKENTFVSEITRIEVLGYYRLTNDEELYFKDVFSLIPIIIPDQYIYDRALTIRKEYNLKLGDAIIAATAIVHNLSILTRNLKDFERIGSLNCINPIK